MPETRSRTSLAAPSMSRPMVELDGDGGAAVLALETMERMPSTPEMRSSMSWVMRVSTTLAEAPG
jgi:hypothetical protein